MYIAPVPTAMESKRMGQTSAAALGCSSPVLFWPGVIGVSPAPISCLADGPGVAGKGVAGLLLAAGEPLWGERHVIEATWKIAVPILAHHKTGLVLESEAAGLAFLETFSLSMAEDEMMGRGLVPSVATRGTAESPVISDRVHLCCIAWQQPWATANLSLPWPSWPVLLRFGTTESSRQSVA